MAFKTVEDRRVNFIHGLVDLCRKHRVLLNVDWNSLHEVPDDQLPVFEEHGTSQFSFSVSLADVEQFVREALWELFNIPKPPAQPHDSPVQAAPQG